MGNDLSSAAAEAVESAAWHLQKADVDALQTMLAGVLSVQWFTLLAQLITVGVLLVIVFVIAVRRV